MESLRPPHLQHADTAYKHLEAKSQRARLTGYATFALTLMIALGILSLFLYAQPLDTTTSKSAEAITGGIKSSSEEVIKRDIVGVILNSIVTRIGAVLVGIYIIQILVGFSRYYFRLAEHLSSCAEVILLTGGDPGGVKDLAPIIIAQFDFGKVPPSPFQKIAETAMDTMKELSKRVPTR